MEYKIKSKIWIEVDDKVFLGAGRIKLLKSLNITKSLSKSAKELGMSYKKAWNLIDSLGRLIDLDHVVYVLIIHRNIAVSLLLTQ